MRYDLGLMDMYPIEVSGTKIENDPMFEVTLKSKIDPQKLEDAVYRAMKFHPLFATQVRYDGSYFLQSNNRPVKLIHAKLKERPLEFCSTTNGYPWQMCWYDRTITLEWCHGITDGRGAFDFIKSVLSIYCGMEVPVVPRKIMLGPGLEPFVNKKEKGVDYSVDPKGFSKRALPVYDRGFKTDCYVLSAKAEEITKLSTETGSSPSVVFSVLLSQAIRNQLPAKERNKNVACNIVMDLRKPLKYETMHNCVEYKRITYQDKHNSMSFADICHEYKKKLDHARIPENVVRMITERVNEFELAHVVKFKSLRHGVMKIAGEIMKDTDCNCVMTYLGKTDFPEEVNEMIEDFQFRVWHDFGECILAAVDFNGTFRMNLCENYMEKGIVENFITLCAEAGIHINCLSTMEYEQGRFVEEGNTKTKVKLRRSEERAPKESRAPFPEALGSPAMFL